MLAAQDGHSKGAFPRGAGEDVLIDSNLSKPRTELRGKRPGDSHRLVVCPHGRCLPRASHEIVSEAALLVDGLLRPNG